MCIQLAQLFGCPSWRRRHLGLQSEDLTKPLMKINYSSNTCTVYYNYIYTITGVLLILHMMTCSHAHTWMAHTVT